MRGLGVEDGQELRGNVASIYFLRLCELYVTSLIHCVVANRTTDTWDHSFRLPRIATLTALSCKMVIGAQRSAANQHNPLDGVVTQKGNIRRGANNLSALISRGKVIPHLPRGTPIVAQDQHVSADWLSKLRGPWTPLAVGTRSVLTLTLKLVEAPWEVSQVLTAVHIAQNVPEFLGPDNLETLAFIPNYRSSRLRC